MHSKVIKSLKFAWYPNSFIFPHTWKHSASSAVFVLIRNNPAVWLHSPESRSFLSARPYNTWSLTSWGKKTTIFLYTKSIFIHLLRIAPLFSSFTLWKGFNITWPHLASQCRIQFSGRISFSSAVESINKCCWKSTNLEFIMYQSLWAHICNHGLLGAL